MARTYWLCLFVLFVLLNLGCATTRQQVKIGMVPRLSNPPSTAILASAGARAVAAPAVVSTPAFGPMAAAPRGRSQVGTASYYHSFFEGRTTANGQTFSNEHMTAASRTLDFGTRVRVTNLMNLKSVIVTINDRGPYVDGRIIDLSRRAASTLGFVREGVARVRVERL
jgi:peptidoglycan lytic transglycosylase